MSVHTLHMLILHYLFISTITLFFFFFTNYVTGQNNQRVSLPELPEPLSLQFFNKKETLATASNKSMFFVSNIGPTSQTVYIIHL